jgi:hypothetical protein
MIKKIIFIVVLLAFQVIASKHGIYLKTHELIKKDISKVTTSVVDLLKENSYEILFNGKLTTPDYVKKEKEELCGFKANLIVFSSEKYRDILTLFGNKYLIGGFLRVGIYENENGVNIIIIDPETIARIIFNDLYENDKEKEYNKIVTKMTEFKNNLITLLHTLNMGKKVTTVMEPIRDDDDLAESSKDMFMMVGPMTFFNDEEQFPEIYSSQKSISEVQTFFESNIKKFIPTDEDKEYRWSPNPEKDLHWKIISKTSSNDGKALLLGITRPRTEGVSFHIAGVSRENKTNRCPGIDHATAYPIEILIIKDNGITKVYTQREMFRMDMYFWDAGMSAFMNHMSMPGILDESIKKALLGKDYSK